MVQCPIVSVNSATMFPIRRNEKYFCVDDVSEYSSFVLKFPSRIRAEFDNQVSQLASCSQTPSVPLSVQQQLENVDFGSYGVVWQGTLGWAAAEFLSNREKLREILELNRVDTSTTTLSNTYHGGERAAHERLASFLKKGLETYGLTGGFQVRGARNVSPYGSLVRLYHYISSSVRSG